LVPPECDAETAGRRDATADSPSWTWSAGGAISTLPDLKIWARALAIGTLLTPTTQAERLDWVPTGPPPAPRYGLHITDFAGVIGHDGALPGYQSFMGYLPARDATLVVLANVFPDAECGSPADEIAKVILRQLQLLALPDADPRSESRGTTGEPETTNSGVQ
jgi:D-alanyl-D-alanine carboxypeptidase